MQLNFKPADFKAVVPAFDIEIEAKLNSQPTKVRYFLVISPGLSICIVNLADFFQTLLDLVEQPALLLRLYDHSAVGHEYSS